MYKLLVVAVVFVYFASAAPPPTHSEIKKDFKKGWEPLPEPEPEPGPWGHHLHKTHPDGRLPIDRHPARFEPHPPPYGQGPGGKKGYGDAGDKGGPGKVAPNDPKSGIGGPGKGGAVGGQGPSEGNRGGVGKPGAVPVGGEQEVINKPVEGGSENSPVEGGSENSPVDTAVLTPENGQPSVGGETGSAPVDGVNSAPVDGAVGENSGGTSESERNGSGLLDVRAKKP